MSLSRRLSVLLCLGLLLSGCPSPPTPDGAGGGERAGGEGRSDDGKGGPDEEAPGEKKVLPPMEAEKAPAEASRLPAEGSLQAAANSIQSYFDGQRPHRTYVQIDKPMYQPGETIWVKAWDLDLRELKGAGAAQMWQLKSPKGAIVEQKRVQAENGFAHNAFDLPASAQGGEYTLVVHGSGGMVEKAVLVSAYEPPRVKKTLEFVRKAYGPGDEVAATIVVKRPTGEPLAGQVLRARITLDGEDLEEVRLTTNAHGGGMVKVKLPSRIEVGDGLLTVFVDDGGVTESISKRVPIVLRTLRLSFFPEGGKPVQGLEGRVYFEAKNPLDKPADIEGQVVDDHGNTVARLKSHWGGLGRFSFTPQPGRTYKVEVTQPVGVVGAFPLPLAEEKGCLLRHYDDLDGQEQAVRVGVTCTEARTVQVVAVQRDHLLDAAAVKVEAGREAAVWLKAPDAAWAGAQGVARITLFDDARRPLAERIVYRNRRSRLQVAVEPHRESYMPRDQVRLVVRTTDGAGQPVPAELALSVVDDTVVSFADDKSGHLLSQVLLEPELPGKVEEPKFFLDLTEKKSALALDLLMGTRGWRKFEWQPVWSHPFGPAGDGDVSAALSGTARHGMAEEPDGEALEGAELEVRVGNIGRIAALRGGQAMPPPPPGAPPAALPAPKAAEAPARRMAAAAPKPMREAKREEHREAERAPAKKQARVMKDRAARNEVDRPMPAADKAAVAGLLDDAIAAAGVDARMAAAEAVAGPPMNQPMPEPVLADPDFDGERQAAARGRLAPMAWAPVRVFPAPTYGGTDVPQVRTDFRETIHWEPTVRTDRTGEATVTFYLSDAVTSFRVFAEGVGGGLLGREEKVIKSSLPFSMSIKLPLEVSAGDHLQLPLTLTNERSEPLQVAVTAGFGALLTQTKPADLQGGSLAAGARQSAYYELDVTGVQGATEVAFAADASGLKDEFKRTLKVEPLGFPQEGSASGQVGAKEKHTFDLKGAEPGTVTASVRFYPSPVATMVSGLDGLLRQPSGCFEQASSSNYPNVMILQQLQQTGDVAPDILERSQRFLDEGYKKLTGYESQSRGYEWFGADPGHEALTAYGLLEFVDMKEVYAVDKAMIDRTAQWLLARRDKKGGFERNGKALDSFGRASQEVTDGYITWALSEAGYTDQLSMEIQAQKKVASTTQDAYLLALAANTLLNGKATASDGKAAVKRLLALQDKDGSFKKADHSVTRSGGQNLVIETTALATVALLKADQVGPAGKAVKWLMENRGGYGQWGATQATILSLKALLRYADETRRAQSPGSVIVKVNGKVAARMNYEAGRKEPMVFEGLGASFVPGENQVELLHDGKGELPYSVALEWRTSTPASSPEAVVDLVTSLDKTELKMGETVRAWATVKNKTSQGQPMTLVRVGLPGGLTFQSWQLKELREQGKIAFFETRPREVILYFRALAPGEEKKIPLDLVATVPGTYTGPASRAYLYYTDEHKVWTDPFKVVIQPG